MILRKTDRRKLASRRFRRSETIERAHGVVLHFELRHEGRCKRAHDFIGSFRGGG